MSDGLPEAWRGLGLQANDASIDAVNLSGTLRRSDHGSITRPQSAWVNDRQPSTGLSLQF